MRAHKPQHDFLRLAAVLSLLLLPEAAAQRRPIAPPGVKLPVPKVETPAPESKQRSLELPADKPTEPPASEPAPTPTADAVNEPAPGPKGPEILLPNDESRAPQPVEAKPSLGFAQAREVVYRKKLDKFAVTLRVRPATHLPGRSATLTFEISELLERQDPVAGSRKPLEGGVFVVNFSHDGNLHGRYKLHPIENAGTYGLHFTAPATGVYRVELFQYLESREIGDVPLAAEFLVGFGRDTPMEEVANEEDIVQVHRSRRALRVVSSNNRAAPSDVMFELGEHWMALRAALEEPQADAEELAVHAQAIKDLTSKVAAQGSAGPALEFNQLAAGLEPLSGFCSSGFQPAAVLQTMDRTELDTCSRCHARFRFRLTDDVSRWPQFSLTNGN